MLKKLSALYFCLLTFTFLLVLSADAQSLTVRDIMREPSLAGMRPDSERISPDGSKVVFSWNAEGKEPRNLYLWTGSEARILVNAEQNFEQRTPLPESKLNYGLIVRDDFVKAREKNLFGVEFSPDSKRILFLQNTDIYILDLNNQPAITSLDKNAPKPIWSDYEKVILRRADLIPGFVDFLSKFGIQEIEIFDELKSGREKLLSFINETSEKSESQQSNIISFDNAFGQSVLRLLSLEEPYPQLRSAEQFQNLKKELEKVQYLLQLESAKYRNNVWESQKLISPRRVTRTQGLESSARWLTNDSILYSSNGNFFVLNLRETSLVQVTKEANPQAFQSIFNATPSKDGRLLGYVVSDGSRQRALFVPNYLDEFTTAPIFRRGWTEQRVFVTLTDGSRENPFEIKLPKAEGVSYIRSLRWAADNQSLLVDRIDRDTKRRQLFYISLVGSKAEKIVTVTEEVDEKWVAPLSRLVEPHPTEASQIVFASERDGYNHLYLANLEKDSSGFSGKVNTRQLTKGNYEVDWVKWSGDDRLIYSSTEANTAEREFYHLLPATNTKSLIATGQKGMRTNPQIADPGNQISKFIYGFSQWNQPTELFMQSSCNVKCELGQPQQITKTTPENFQKVAWSTPKFIDIPSRDGKQIKSKIYLPNNFDKTKKYPMVIFVHGAGYLQNTINGWNNYYREFMFHHILTNKGYVVLDIDFRGSAGYGRDWRTDVHDFLGGKDYEDHLDSIDYMVKNYAVDAKRVGVYGGSYGGFMAGMLVMRAPDKVAAAAALRPVFDWKNYFASSNVYTTERLGFPDKNPEAYKRSSPIAYADKLEKPLLILHGLLDDNVHAQDSIQLVEKLMRLEKTQYFEVMFYPAENHGFTRPTSWADEYERILSFFEKHLK